MTYVDPTFVRPEAHADADAVGVSRPDPVDEQELYMDYGSGGHDVKIVPVDDGVVEGISGTVAQGLNKESPWKSGSDIN